MNSNRARFATLALLAIAATGCGYGQVSPATYDHAKELYTIANLRAEASLDAVEAGIDQKAADGRLSEREASWLRDICEQCRNGKWSDAQKAARRIMEDQVRS